MKKAFLMTALVLFTSITGLAQTLTKVTITYATTGDDKDWNTQVRDNITCNGLIVAQLNCCDQNQNMDHWNNNTTTSRDILSPQAVSKASLSGCTFNFGMVAVGNDTWKVIPTIQMFFDVGPSITQGFPEQWLISDNSLASVALAIK